MIPMATHNLNFGSKTIEYQLDFQQRKTLGIKVFPDNSVHVLAPFDTEIGIIESKVKQKATWIFKQQREFLSYMPKKTERQFIGGETHLYLGRQYLLDIAITNKNEVKIQRGKLLITHKPTSNPQRVLDLWYKEKATLYFDKIVDESIMLFVKYNIEKPGIQIKKMQKRWGSCSIKGKIILNLELIKAPKGSIEYVVIHELCHLIHHNHTKAFYDLQERIMPDWKKWKTKLEKTL